MWKDIFRPNLNENEEKGLNKQQLLENFYKKESTLLEYMEHEVIYEYEKSIRIILDYDIK